MDTIHIDITGAQQVGLRFEEFPDVLYDDLRKEIDELSAELYSRVEFAAPELSGKLKSQIRLRLFTDKNRITGYVDIAGGNGSYDFAKAGALEWGSTGEPYERAAHSMKLDHLWSEKLLKPMTVMVKAFSAPGHIGEHAFERGSLAAMSPEVLARLNAVVERATAKANA